MAPWGVRAPPRGGEAAPQRDRIPPRGRLAVRCGRRSSPLPSSISMGPPVIWIGSGSILRPAFVDLDVGAVDLDRVGIDPPPQGRSIDVVVRWDLPSGRAERSSVEDRSRSDRGRRRRAGGSMAAPGGEPLATRRFESLTRTTGCPPWRFGSLMGRSILAAGRLERFVGECERSARRSILSTARSIRPVERSSSRSRGWHRGRRSRRGSPVDSIR